MAKAGYLFSSLSEEDSELHIQLGNNAKYLVKGQGTMQFQLDSGGSLMHRRYYMYLALRRTSCPSQSWRIRVIR
jgi:hypothetical protein